MNAKERDKKVRQGRRVKKRKGIEAQRGKPPTPTRAFEALIGDEEQNEKQKKKKKDIWSGPPPQIQSPPTTPIETILLTPPPRPTGAKYIAER